jgi:hypothetical protein
VHVDGLRASNLFWDNFYETCWFGAFPIVSSLREITAQSDLVVRGTIVDLYGVLRNDAGFETAYAKVLMGEVLKGSPVTRKPGEDNVIHVIVGSGYELERLRSSLPAHDHLWFLKQDGSAATYFTTDYEQMSLLREIDGFVRVLSPDYTKRVYSARHYPVPLEGTDFEELVERVREIVNTPQGSSPGARLLAC